MMSTMRNIADDSPPGGSLVPQVAVVAKAIDLMEQLGNGEARTVAELAEAAGITRGAAYRILGTLESRGWVMRHGSVRRYAIGPAPVALGRVRPFDDDLIPAGREYLQRLWEAFGETVNLGVPMGGRILYVDTIESAQRLRTTSRVGTIDPLHSTALGKAILASYGDEGVTRLLGSTELDERTPATLSSLPLLLTDLERTRQRGYAIDDEENEVGSRCVAAVVVDADGRALAALSVSAPLTRFDDERIETIGSEIVACCRDLADDLARAARHDRAAQAENDAPAEAAP